MLRRRAGRPGLAGTMARTAVIAGTATAVSGSVQRNAAARAASQAQPPAPAPVADQPSPATDEKINKIRELGKLHAEGLLSDDEFTAAKSSILGI